MNNIEGKLKLSHCQTPKIQTNSYSKEILAEFHQQLLQKKNQVCLHSFQIQIKANLGRIVHDLCSLLLYPHYLRLERRQLSLPSFLPRAHSCMAITLFCLQMAFAGVSQPAFDHIQHLSEAFLIIASLFLPSGSENFTNFQNKICKCWTSQWLPYFLEYVIKSEWATLRQEQMQIIVNCVLLRPWEQMLLFGIFLPLIQKAVIHSSDDLTCSKPPWYSIEMKLFLMQTSKKEQMSNALPVLSSVQYKGSSGLSHRIIYFPQTLMEKLKCFSPVCLNNTFFLPLIWTSALSGKNVWSKDQVW